MHGNQLSLISPGGLQLVKALTPVLAATANGEGGGGFLNGFTVNTQPLFDFDQNIIKVDDADTTSLIQNIKIAPVSEVTEESSNYLVDTLNRLGNDPVEAAAAKADFKARPAHRDRDSASNGYNNQDLFQEEAMGRMLHHVLPHSGLTVEAAAKVKKSRRRPTDRHYVSREPHEFDYCMKPLKRANDRTTIEVVADAGDHIINPAQEPTLGLFIDFKKFRVGIELWRRLNNVSHSQNAKKITTLLGTTRQDFLESLIQEPATKAKLVEACTGVPFLQAD